MLCFSVIKSMLFMYLLTFPLGTLFLGELRGLPLCKVPITLDTSITTESSADELSARRSRSRTR